MKCVLKSHFCLYIFWVEMAIHDNRLGISWGLLSILIPEVLFHPHTHIQYSTSIEYGYQNQSDIR